MIKFYGRETMRVDPKGRVPIPARFLSVLKSLNSDPDVYRQLGVIVSPDRSLRIMPRDIFEKLTEEWDGLNHNKSDERMSLNVNYSSSEPAELDGQERLKLSPMVVEECEIDMKARTVVFIGGPNYIQMFDEAAWKQYRAKGREKLPEITDKLAEKTDKPAAPRQITLDMSRLVAMLDAANT